MSILEVERLVGGYSGVPVLHELDLRIDSGELVALVGANGAGKTTLLRTIAGLNRAMSGSIRFAGADVTSASASNVASAGIGHVPENRRVFPQHSVVDNLLVGAYVRRRDRKGVAEDVQRMLDRFPILRDRASKSAGGLSGGEQQLLALAIALMARPKLLMLDEPSLGLAPLMVEEVFSEIALLREHGSTILLVEQLATAALGIADRGIVLHLGRILAEGTAERLLADDELRRVYFSGGASSRAESSAL